MATQTLGKIINQSLKEIGEPEVTAFTADNILQQRMIEEANDTVEEIMTYGDFRWALKHVNIATTADIETEQVALTNGSATVSSVDDDDVSADNFGSVTTDMWFRRTSDNVSYPIASIDTSGTPDTLVLGTSAATGTRTYVGTTTTGTGYRIFQDTFDLTTSDIDEIKHITYGDAPTWNTSVSGSLPDGQIRMVNLQTIMNTAGGDLHRHTGGKPQLATIISNDADENQRLLLWPFPTEVFLVDLWYKTLIGENTTFATNLFGGDAPGIAYQAVSHRVKVVASTYDEDYRRADMWEKRYQAAIGHLMRRENRQEIDTAFGVNTYRMTYANGMPARSGIHFSTKGAQR
jgi:hypothetical protein